MREKSPIEGFLLKKLGFSANKMVFLMASYFRFLNSSFRVVSILLCPNCCLTYSMSLVSWYSSLANLLLVDNAVMFSLPFSE